MAKIIFLMGLLLMLALPVLAQDENIPLVDTIFYDRAVTETINADATFDWWQLQANPGDVIVAQMAAADGLAPLLGILAPGGEMVANTLDQPAEINAIIKLEYTAQTSGIHTIVASRYGRLEGTTSGSYTLLVSNARLQNVRPPSEYQEVTFRCQDFEVTTLATVVFGDDVNQMEFHQIALYGLDGLQPVIRIHLSQPDITDCSQTSKGMDGDEVILPGEEPFIVTGDLLDYAAQIGINEADQMGTITLTIGARDGTPGRYVAVLTGFSIAPRGDKDHFTVRLGPMAKDTAMQVVMVGDENTRLDPFMVALDEDADIPIRECDDAGRRGCEDVTDFVGAGIKFSSGLNIIGDQFDTSLRLTPGHPDPISLDLASREGDTIGGYALIILGELPARE